MTAKQTNQNPTPPAADHHDDLVVVPKEQSKLMYYFILALMLFVLVIFTIGDTFQSAMTGGGGSSGGEIYVTWVDPLTGDEHSMQEADFMERKQSIQLLMEIGLWSPADPEATRASAEDEDVLLYQVLDQLAADSGMVVSDQEYINTLGGAGYTNEILRSVADRFRMDGRKVQAIIKHGLRPAKMLQLLMRSGVTYTDPLAIEAAWKENNPEFGFQYIELKREDYVDQARANALPEEELITWLDEQPSGGQQRYQTEPKVRAEVVWVNPGEEFDATQLLEKYPAAEGTDADARGLFYFNTARSTRYRYVEPETDEGVDDATDAATDETADAATDETPQKPEEPTKFYYEYDEVKDQAIAEAATWDAMTAFLEDVRARMQVADSDVDWMAEAAALGLTATSMEQPLERSKIAEMEGWGGRNLSNQLSFAQIDTFVPRVQVEEGGMVIAKLLEKIEPERKPWEEIKEEVLTQWARANAIELAVDSLQGILEICAERGMDDAGAPLSNEEWKPTVSAEDLRKSAGAANFTLVERPMLTRTEWPGDDPNLATNADRFLQGQPDLYELEPGQVGYPRKDFTGDRAYLVRLNKVADPDPKKKMKAQAVLSLRQSSQAELAQNLAADLYPKSEWFSETFSVMWPAREARAAREAKEKEADESN